MNGQVMALSKVKTAAFQSGDKEAYNTTIARLKAGIRQRVKMSQAAKAEVPPSCVNPHCWMG